MYIFYSDIIDIQSNVLNEHQITELLNENIENIDEQFQRSEYILNDVNKQNIGNSSIFTGKFYLFLLYFFIFIL